MRQTMNRKTTHKVALNVTSTILGGVFIVAAFSKFSDLAKFYEDVKLVSFLPFPIDALVALTLPGLEMTLGIFFLVKNLLREVSLLAFMLLLVFTFYAVYNVLAGNAETCHCFKLPTFGGVKVSGWGVVVRDALFAGAAMTSYVLKKVATEWEG